MSDILPLGKDDDISLEDFTEQLNDLRARQKGIEKRRDEALLMYGNRLALLSNVETILLNQCPHDDCDPCGICGK